jgi:murein DD-endopeptidase MepM/ murein hydrolase activator NlpD
MIKIKTNLTLLFLVAALASSFLFIYKAAGLDCNSTILTLTEIDKCNAQKSALEEKAKTYNSIIKLKEKQAATISDQLQLIDLAQQKTTQELTSASKKLNALKDQTGDLTEKIKESERQIDFQRKMLRALMQSYYEYDQQGILDLVLLEKNLSDSLRGSDYIQQSGMKINELLAEIRKIKTELEEQKTQLEEKKNESEQLKETLENKNLTLQNNEYQKEILLGQTQQEKEKYSRLLANIEDEIYNLESTKLVDYSNVPAAKGGYFNYPVSSATITQSYGCLQDSFARGSYPACNGGKGGFHNGLDFGKNSGNNIFSARSGKVIGSGNNGRYAYGQWLAVDHGDGLVTLYGHLSSKSVSKGNSVKAGQKIGVMGSTGYSTGTHLHFSVFDKKSFEIVESTHVSGLMIPTGGSLSPKRYLK